MMIIAQPSKNRNLVLKIDCGFSRESFSCSEVNGFSALSKQTSGLAPDYLTAEQTTPNQNWYHLNRVLESSILVSHWLDGGRDHYVIFSSRGESLGSVLI